MTPAPVWVGEVAADGRCSIIVTVLYRICRATCNGRSYRCDRLLGGLRFAPRHGNDLTA